MLRKAALIPFLAFMLLRTQIASAQPAVNYDEVTVTVNVHLVGATEVTALITDHDVYLPIAEIFNFVKIKSYPSANLDSVTGFFINQRNTYLVDFQNKKIILDGKSYQVKPSGIIKNESGLYLKTSYFNDIFQMKCK